MKAEENTRRRLVVWLWVAGLCAPGSFAFAQIDNASTPTLPCGFALLEVNGQNIPTLFPCPLQGQPMSGVWSKTIGSSDQDTTVCRGCSFTTGKDIKPQLETHFPAGFADPTHQAFVDSLPVWDPDGGLRQQYKDVIAAASPHLPANPGAPLLDRLQQVRDVLAPFAALAGTVIPDPHLVSQQKWARAFAPMHGRHTVREFTLPITLPPPFGWLEHNYADPQCLAELRWRGARSYCAMREAALFADGARLSLGNWSAGDALFWTVGGVNPTLSFLPPHKELDAPSAQAFAIPLRIGGNLTPARGPALPDFGDLVHPLVWLTADAEVLTNEDFGAFFLPPTECFGRGVCKPNPQSGFRRRSRNMKHVDVLAGTSASATLTVPDVLLATFGPASLFLNGTITIDSGLLEDGSLMRGGAVVDPSAPDPWPKSQWPSPRADVLDVFGTSGSDASDAPLRRLLSGGQFLRPVEGGVPQTAWSILLESPPGSPVAFGTTVRWWNDDDRSIAIRDSIREDMSIVGKLGFPLGPIEAFVSGSSTLTARSSQVVAFREHLSAVEPSLLGLSLPRRRLAQSNVVVVAEPYSEVSYDPLTLKLHLSLEIDLAFKTIKIGWVQQFLKLQKLPLAGVVAEPAPEQDRLRVGEFSEVGLTAFDGAQEKPAAYSHLPGGAEFVSFPNTVAECLADPTQPVEPVPPDPVKPGGPPIDGELCAVGIQALSGPLENLGPVPANVCDGGGSIDAYAAGYVCTAGDEICQDRRTCLVSTLTFLCSPVHKVQTWYTPPQTVLSHVLTPGEHGTVGALVKQCVEAFAKGEADAQGVAELFAEEFIDFIACSNDGTLLGSP